MLIRLLSCLLLMGTAVACANSGPQGHPPGTGGSDSAGGAAGRSAKADGSADGTAGTPDGHSPPANPCPNQGGYMNPFCGSDEQTSTGCVLGDYAAVNVYPFTTGNEMTLFDRTPHGTDVSDYVELWYHE